MTTPEHPFAQVLLDLPARLYGKVMQWRNRHFDKDGRRARVNCPVVSVGNLTVGGTGKTPFVAALAHYLLDLGARPAVVSRGYGGSAGKGPELLCDGEGPQLGADVAGDEPYLLAQKIPQLVIVVGSDRVAGAKRAIECGANIILLDDGFQHRRIERDLDIVLLDSSDPFGSYRMLPAGRLREPIRGLSRADLIVITRAEANESFAVIERVIREHNPDAPILRANHRSVGFFSAGEAQPHPERAVVFCGIGNPNRLKIDLERQGIEIVSFSAKRDHQPYQQSELSLWAAKAQASNAVLLTTEKDLARIPKDWVDSLGTPIVTANIEANIHEPAPLHQTLQALLQTES